MNMPANLLLIQLYGYSQPPSAEPLAIEVLGAAIAENHKSVNVILDTVNVRSLVLQRKVASEKLKLSDFFLAV
jgi:hypothetical protein